MKLAGFIARRWLRGSSQVRLLTWVAIGSVALASFSVIVTAAITQGFQSDFEQKLQGLAAAVTVDLPARKDPSQIVLTPEALDAERVVPFVEGYGLILAEERSIPVKILGLGLGFKPPAGIHPFVAEWESQWHGGVGWVGSELAFEAGILSVSSRKIKVVVAGGRLGPTGELESTQGTIESLGTFQTGYYESDSGTLIVPYDFGRRLLGPLARRGFRIDLPDVTQTVPLMQTLSRWPGLADARLTSWSEGHHRLLGILKLERIGMSLLLGLVLVVAAMGLVGLLLVQATHKVHGGAVLQALGMPVRDLLSIWRWQGGLVGMVGGWIGMFLAAGLLLWLKRVPIPMPSGYYLQTVPVAWTPFVWGIVAVVTPCLGIAIASLLKGRFVAFRPAEVLRDE